MAIQLTASQFRKFIQTPGRILCCLPQSEISKMSHLTVKWFPRRRLNGYLASERGYVRDVRNVASSPAEEDRLSCESGAPWLRQQVELLSSHPPLFWLSFSLSPTLPTQLRSVTPTHTDTQSRPPLQPAEREPAARARLSRALTFHRTS